MVHMIEPLTYSFLKPKRHSLFHCFPPLKLRKLRINSKLQNQPRNTIHKFRMMQRWFYIKNKTYSVLLAVTQSFDCLMSRSLTEGRNWRRTELNILCEDNAVNVKWVGYFYPDKMCYTLSEVWTCGTTNVERARCHCATRPSILMFKFIVFQCNIYNTQGDYYK